MYYPVELVLNNYKPLHLEKGMLFIKRHSLNTEDEYLEIWELKNILKNEEEFIQENGYPIELSLVDDNDHLVANHKEIGWWSDNDSDENDFSEELRDIKLKDINSIFQNYDGICEVEIDEFYISKDVITAKLFEGRVVIRELTEEFEEE